jgi:hypothetical protein
MQIEENQERKEKAELRLMHENDLLCHRETPFGESLSKRHATSFSTPFSMHVAIFQQGKSF